MIIYIDNEYRCHTSNPDGLYREFDVPFFDDKCTEMVEGYRYIPNGDTLIINDTHFEGEMIFPFKNYSEIIAIQRDYELRKMAELTENSISTEELETAYQEGVDSV